jgi:CBS domain-containing protein
MRVSEVMTSNVTTIAPAQTIKEAAECMSALDVGALPVGEDGRLIGMITDRDIVVRGVAHSRGPDTLVGDVMSSKVCYCYQDQELGEIAANMGDIQVRRLPVLDREKQLVGIVSLGDIAASDVKIAAAAALHDISRPGGLHTQL